MSHSSTVVCINNSGSDLIIVSDPNWDDQSLKIDGREITSPFSLGDGKSVGVSVSGWTEGERSPEMMGIWFVGPDNDHDNRNNYMVTVGANSEEVLDITDSTLLKPLSFSCVAVTKAKWELVLLFNERK